MQSILNVLKRKSNYGRLLPFAVLSAVLVLVGLRADSDEAEGQTINFRENDNPLIP